MLHANGEGTHWANRFESNELPYSPVLLFRVCLLESQSYGSAGIPLLGRLSVELWGVGPLWFVWDTIHFSILPQGHFTADSTAWKTGRWQQQGHTLTALAPQGLTCTCSSHSVLCRGVFFESLAESVSTSFSIPRNCSYSCSCTFLF